MSEKTRRRRLLLAAQAVLSAAMLTYVFLKVDLASAGAAALRANLALLAASLIQLCLQFALIATRWKIIISALGGDLPFAPALRYVWIGGFVGQVLPGAIGADAARMWLYWLRCRSTRIAVYSVAVERLIMVLVLMFFVLAIQPSLLERGAPAQLVYPAIVLLLGIACGVVILFFSTRLLAANMKWRPVRALVYAAADLRVVFASFRRIGSLLALSLLSYLNMAVAMWLIGRALGLDVLFADYVAFTPLIVLAATLPLSVGGWGIREGATILVFGLAGVAASDALALSLMFGIGTAVVTLPGAVLWIWREKGVKLAHMELDPPSKPQ